MASRLYTPRSLVLPLNGYRKPAQPTLDWSHPLSKGLVAYYPLGDSPTKLTRDIVGTNNGTNVGTPVLTSSHHGGLAHQFDGSSAYVTFPSSVPVPENNLGADNGAGISVFCWVYANALSNSYNCLVQRSPDANSFWEIFIKSNGKIATYFAEGGHGDNYDGTGSNTLVTGTWYFVGFTYRNGNVGGSLGTGYVNGAVDGTTAGSLLNMHNISSAGAIGNDIVTASRLFNGVISDVRIYNRLLFLAEIQRLYCEPYAGVYEQRQYVKVASSSVDANVNLVAVSAAGSAQSITPEVDKTLSIVSGVGSAQALTPEVDKTLTAVSTSGVANAVTVTGTGNVNLAAVSAAGSTQAVGIEVDKTLDIASASGAVTSFVPSVSTTLGAVSGTGAAANFGFSFGKDVNLVATSATGAVNPFTFAITSNVNLPAVHATGTVGSFIFPSQIVTLPVFTLMRSDPVAVNGAMGVDS